MKPSHPITVFLLLFFIHTGTLSAQDSKEILIGTWSFNYDSSISKMNKGVRAKMDSLPQRQHAVERLYRGRNVVFAADGKYSQILGDGQSSHGSWVLYENSVKINWPDGNVESFNVQTLDSRIMVLRQQNNGKGKLILPEWHFIKN